MAFYIDYEILDAASNNKFKSWNVYVDSDKCKFRHYYMPL